MKTTLTICLMLMAAWALPSPARASSAAADGASSSAYNSGWSSGQNGGYGFGPWTNIAVTNGGYAGFFLATTNTHQGGLNGIWSGSGRAWGTFANGTNFNHAVAFRPFTDGGLATGQTFTIYMENGIISNGGSCGFCLRTGFVANTANDYNTGRRFEFGFLGGSNNYFIVDGSSGGAQFNTGVPWTSNGVKIALTLLSANTYTLEVVRLQNATTNRYGRSFVGTGGIQSLALYNRNTDHAGQYGDVYFNKISISEEPPSPYTLLPGTRDSGGRRITNAANQVVDTSIGGPFGLLANDAGQVTKAGYPAQLYDVVGLSITASPPTVDEESARAMLARYGCDDGTVLPLPGGAAAWSKISGPLDSVTPSGDHTADALADSVYQNAPAVAQATWQGLTGRVDLLVLNIDPDNYASYRGDEVDDAWQVDNFGEENPDGYGSADPDEDTRDNRHEYIAGTDPTDEESYFRLWGERVANVHTQVDLYYHPHWSDRRYDAERTTNLVVTGWNPLPAHQDSVVGVTTGIIRDLNTPTTKMYYRVGITKDP